MSPHPDKHKVKLWRVMLLLPGVLVISFGAFRVVMKALATGTFRT